MAIEMRRAKSSVDHAIDLRPAFEIYVGLIKEPERCSAEQSGQRVELAGVTSCQRWHGGKRSPNREIEVKTKRQIGTRLSAGDGVSKRRQIDDQ